MKYLKVTIPADPEKQEILVAELSEVGFDSFEQKDEVIECYVSENQFNKKLMNAILHRMKVSTAVQAIPLEDKNWNAEWESHFEPISIGRELYVRAGFHKPGKGFGHELVITPQMSFGTGHHATTYQMLEFLLEADPKGKSVMDVGCGTGILAIFAAMKGADPVVAFDNEEWAVKNAKANATANGQENIAFHQCTIGDVRETGFDFVLANINKNVILNELPMYAEKLNHGGVIAFSGFYVEDGREIDEKCNKIGLTSIKTTAKENWACLCYQKP